MKNRRRHETTGLSPQRTQRKKSVNEISAPSVVKFSPEEFPLRKMGERIIWDHEFTLRRIKYIP